MAHPWVFAIAFLLDGLASAAHAAALQGVWEGTLGDQGILACFNGADRGTSYYYKRFLGRIPLSRTAQDTSWHEEVETGLWALDAPVGATLSGPCSDPYDLTLEATGMRFYRMPDYGGGCEADILVPYHRLSPVLSREGKAAVRRIIGSQRRLRQ